MGPYSLHLAGALLTFLLKVTAGFILCLGLAKLLSSPRHRFLTWLGFLLGAGLSWITLIMDEVVALFAPMATGANPATTTHRFSGEHLFLPASWSIWIGRGAALLGAAYILIALTFVAREVLKHIRLHAWLRHGQQPSPELQRIFERLCRDFNIRSCRLLVLPHVSTPATVYWWTPCIVVPDICEDLVSSPQLENILRHELIHTLRCDYLWAMLGDLLCALLFFHPAVWQARRSMMMQRELACDLGVVESRPEQRIDYADSLARFVRLVMLQQNPGLGVDFAAAPSFLGTRIRHILVEPPQVPRWKQLFSETTFAAFIIIFSSISPALSVSLDFSAQPEPRVHAVHSPAAANISRSADTVAPHRRHNRFSIPVVYNDSLTTLPVQNRVHDFTDDPSLQPTSLNREKFTSDPEGPAPPPAASSQHPTLRQQLAVGQLQDAAAISRGERHEHDHDKK